ncbi:MAG: feruloyl-CoA synthase [Rhodobacteraceae bacterium]|nr:feruloyl-CoA synthase [Paracoccaceae bacterium]
MNIGDTIYRAHAVVREDRADGAILLRSGHEMSPAAATSAVWLRHWAEKTGDAVFLAERSGDGWRSVSYAEALARVEAMAAGLLERGMSAGSRLLIVSGNGVDHGLLSLAAHMIGVITVPVAEQYSLIPGAQKQLVHVLTLTDPAMVYASDAAVFGSALALPEMAGRQIVVSANAGAGMTAIDDLRGGGDVAAAAARIGPDTVVKILMTSGSTSAPKGVMTTHGMMCANQAQIADALPFLRTRPPRIVDWLPWNHVFGGSHNFNMMLANGGALYIDEGKPAPHLMPKSISNNRLMNGTLAFNVPVGFAQLRDAMRADAGLRRHYFEDLDMIFYAGASLPQDIWRDLAEMAEEVQGRVPLVTSSWGLTETAPATMIQHEPTTMSGIIGVPMTGVTIKLLPEVDGRYEVRAKGPNIMPGYWNDPEKTAQAFDDEGFFVTGDAMRFVDPDEPSRGMRFDGRISEDFKLMTGTWVRAAQLRLDLLVALAPLAADVVITGADRGDVGLMVVPGAAALKLGDFSDDDGALYAPELAERVAECLRGHGAGKGSAGRIARALILSEPPNLAEGEITAKGNLNFRKLLTRRAHLLERLYAGTDRTVILLAKD